MEAIWHCLFASYRGILESDGGNDYERSRGSHAAHSVSRRVGDDHDQKVSVSLVKVGQEALNRLPRMKRTRSCPAMTVTQTMIPPMMSEH